MDPASKNGDATTQLVVHDKSKRERTIFERDVECTGLILTRRGRAQPFPVKQGLNNQFGGAYVNETEATYWVPEDIPKGWITIWTEGDPEPVSEREPNGYSAQTLEFLVGPYIPRLLADAKLMGDDADERLKALLIGAGAIILVLLGWIIYHA